MLAASSSLFRNALATIAPRDLDEIVFLIPDTNKKELKLLVDFIYGYEMDKSLVNSPLLSLVGADLKENNEKDSEKEKANQRY